jgi:tetratricopeptide (TPR) repeat protein
MLTIQFCGQSEVRRDGTVCHLPEKSIAILAYLLVAADAVPRDDLALKLWSRYPYEADDEYRERALKQLAGRGGLIPLRAALGDYLIDERQSHSLRFNRENPEEFPVEIDFWEFRRERKYESIGERESALDKYHGNFLAPLRFAKDGDATRISFWDWLRSRRLEYRRHYLALVDELVEHYHQQEQYDIALQKLIRCFEVVPPEHIPLKTHQRKIALHAHVHDEEGRVQAYRFSQRVFQELGKTDELDQLNQLRQALNDGSLEGSKFGFLLSTKSESSKPVDFVPFFPIPSYPEIFTPRDETHEIVDTLHHARRVPPVVAVVGMGGSGKTTLATVIAHELAGEFPDGVLWGDFASYAPQALLGAWLKALSPEVVLQGDLAAQYRHVTSRRACLVVLEDVGSQLINELALEERATIRDVLVQKVRQMLPNGRQCAVIMTTRDLDLANALNAQVVELRELGPESALDLVTQYLGENRVQRELHAAQAICDLLGNLPLAIELAGQYLKSRPLSLSSYAEKLRQSPIQQSVARSFEISWQMLDADLQKAFASLSVFDNREYTLEAAEHLLELDSYTVQNRLFDLIGLSLIKSTELERFRQHRLLAAFGKEKLRYFPQLANESMERVSTYFRLFAESHRDQFDLLEREYPNIAAAFEIACEHNPDLILPYLKALERFWTLRGRFDEAYAAYNRALRTLRTFAQPEELAYCLLRLGYIELERNAYDDAVIHLQEGEAIYRQSVDPVGIAEALEYLGRAKFHMEEFESATAYFIESQDIREEIDDYSGIAALLILRAEIPFAEGDYSEAKRLANLAIKYHERPNPRIVSTEREIGLVRTYRLLLDVSVRERNHEEAQEFYEQAINLCDTIDEKAERAFVCYAWSEACRLNGKLNEAFEAIQQSQTETERMGDVLTLGRIFHIRSLIHLDRREFKEALAYNARSLELFEEMDKPRNIATGLMRGGDIYEAQGDIRRACAMWTHAVEIIQTRVPTFRARLDELNERLAKYHAAPTD